MNFIEKRGKQAGKREKLTCHCCVKTNHKASECKFRNYAYNVCSKKGHLAVKCRNRQFEAKKKGVSSFTDNKKREKQNFLEEDLAESFSNLFQLSSEGGKPITIEILVEDEITIFEIDSGSPVSTISESYLKTRKDLGELQVREIARIFRTYFEGTITLQGILKLVSILKMLVTY